MIECPKCHRTERQNRAGKTPSGSHRYRCMFCQIKYTPEPKPWAYPKGVRQKAIQLYVDGMNLRRIARHLGLHHRTVSLWVQVKLHGSCVSVCHAHGLATPGLCV